MPKPPPPWRAHNGVLTVPPRPAEPRALDARMHDALTDLYAYALTLEAESERLASNELREELDAVRETITALRARADPVGRYV
jgi:hypothetical protein